MPNPTPHILYTIGYAGFAPGDLVAQLGARSIGTVADVRSTPFSRHFPWANPEALAPVLAAAGMNHVCLGRELGGRPEQAALYDGDGRVDFARVRQSDVFLAGLNRLLALLHTRPLALLCAETDPARCHRAILVARALRMLHQDIPILHIRQGQADESQEDLDERLLREEGLNGNCLLLQDSGQTWPFPGREDRLEVAYRRRGRAIAFQEERLPRAPQAQGD